MNAATFALPSFGARFFPTPSTSPVPATPLRLRRHELLVRKLPIGQCVECQSGTLWVTFDHLPKDIILEAGDVLVNDQRGQMVVQALQDAIFEIG